MIILFIIIAIDAQAFALSEQSNRSFLVETNPFVEAYDAYTLAGQYIADNAAENLTVLPQTETNDFWLYSHMFSLADYQNDFDIDNPQETNYWILTRENIETIIKYEDMIMLDDKWKNQFCFVGDETADLFAPFFNPGVAETGQTYIYRSFFAAGNPISTSWETVNGSTMHYTEYKNPRDQTAEQEKTYIAWATDLFKQITVDNNGQLVDGNLEIITISWIVYNDYFNVLLQESMFYLIFSIIFVLIYMSIHLGSIFLSIC